MIDAAVNNDLPDPCPWLSCSLELVNILKNFQHRLVINRTRFIFISFRIPEAELNHGRIKVAVDLFLDEWISLFTILYNMLPLDLQTLFSLSWANCIDGRYGSEGWEKLELILILHSYPSVKVLSGPS